MIDTTNFTSSIETSVSSHNININNYLNWVRNYNSALSYTDTLDMNISKFKAMTDEENKAMKALADAVIHANAFDSHQFSKCSEEQQKAFKSTLYTVRNLVTEHIWEKEGDGKDFVDIFAMVKDPKYATIKKTDRQVMFSTMNYYRPTGKENIYIGWNGFQVIDLDIKNEKIARIIKPILFELLSSQHWFLGITLSTSGNGLHIWTKISPKGMTEEKRKVEYRINFRHKYSHVYCALESISYKLDYQKDSYGVTSDEVSFDTMKHWIDMAMCKPQQGTFIPYDPTAELCTNFIDTALDCNFDTVVDIDDVQTDWVEREDLKEVFEKLQYFSDDDTVNNNEILTSEIEDNTDKSLKRTASAKHYKHLQRWQLANTLCAIYGKDEGYKYLRQIVTLDVPSRELQGDMNTASTYHKPVSTWAIKELNNVHGFKIKLKTDSVTEIEDITNDNENIESPTAMLGQSAEECELHLTKDQYLSDIQDDIINNLSSMTILEAGAGFGKTEMVKRLPGRTLLVVPYTSIIKSKVEADKNVNDSWLNYYGTKSMDREGLFSGRSMVMTIDKFAKMNIFDIEIGKFEYVVIDESHLMFTSSFRSVMGGAIRRIANLTNKVKIIMMTGTPTGESLFFPVSKHIKVYKEETRTKNFDIHFCHTKDEVQLEMCKDIAKSIQQGKHILLPTNKGNEYFSQVIGLIQDQLNNEHFGRELKAFYYKKSNTGTTDMDKINMDKSVGENDIIACTNYLSVGVDICDRYDFEVYFCEQWMPQDIEQFTNRLRNNDLHIRMYLPLYDAHGLPYDYKTKRKLTLRYDEQELIRIFNLVQTCNDMLARNGSEMSFNPAVKAILSKQAFIHYDENLCKYFVDETAYKLSLFEMQYGEYIKQLPLIVASMKYYGYQINVKNHQTILTEDQKEQFHEYIKECKRNSTSQKTVETFKFLDTLTDSNIDIYKQIVRGNYEFLRAPEYENDRLNNNIYTRDIEVIEKNMPYITTFNKWYDFDTIKQIYEACTETKSNRITKAKLERIKQFAIIEAQRLKKHLDIPIYKFINESMKWVKANNVNVPESAFQEFIANWTCDYCNAVDNVVVQNSTLADGQKSGAQLYVEQMAKTFTDLFKTLFTVTKHKKSGTMSIAPYKLLWSRKQSLNTMGIENDPMLKSILAEQLIEKMNVKDPDEDIENLSEETKQELNNFKFKSGSRTDEKDFNKNNSFNQTYDYNGYAKADSSNDNFLIKQTKEYEILNGINNNINKYNSPNNQVSDSEVKEIKEKTLFDYDYTDELIESIEPENPIVKKSEIKKSVTRMDGSDDDIVDWSLADELTDYFKDVKEPEPKPVILTPKTPGTEGCPF